MSLSPRAAIGACLLLAATACGVEVVRTPTTLAAATRPVTIVTTGYVNFRLDTSLGRTLEPGMELVQAGTIPEGDVFKPVNRVFMVSGRHAHEAWFVMRGSSLVGFYLPAEQAYSPLSDVVVISHEKRSP